VQSVNFSAVHRLLLGISLALVMAAGLPAVAFGAPVVGVSAPSISSGPSNGTSVANANPSFAFSSSTSGASFTCQLDAGTAAACTSPQAYSYLDQGQHVFKVYASKSGLSNSSTVQVSWTVDTDAPAAPTIVLDAGVAHYNLSSLSWTAESGATFSCSVDFGDAAACTSPKALSGLADGMHSLRVKAIDAAGNASGWATGQWKVDTTAPLAPRYFSGAPGTTTNSTTATVSFSLQESDQTVECKLDSGSWTACTSINGIAGSKSIAGLGEGSHTLSARQTDLAGNVGAVGTSASWTVDLTAPAAPTAITGIDTYADVADANGLPVVSTAYGSSFSFSTTLAEAIAVTGSDTPASRIQCRLDSSGNWASCAASAFAGNTTVSGLRVQTSALADGTHTVSVRQLDAAGNAGSEKTVSFVVYRATPPAVTSFTGVPSSPTSDTSATIGFTVPSVLGFTPRIDYGSEIYCKLDAGRWVSGCTSFEGTSGTFTVSGLSIGTQTVKIGYYLVGNWSDEATATWTVTQPADTTAPATPGPFTGVPTGVTSSTAASIEFTLGESDGTVECRLDSGVWGSCSSVSGTSGSKLLASLADGEHTLSVRQTDAAGNVSAVATSSSWTVDATAPAAPVLSGAPSGSTLLTGASIAFTGEADASFTCSIDGGSYSTCSSPQVFSRLDFGAHSLSVKATDAAGNTGVAATASWTVKQAPITAPSTLTPPAGTKTVYKQKGKWAIKAGLLFATGGDSRSGAQVLTVQVAVNFLGQPVNNRPSDSATAPTSASYAHGVIAWSASGEVSRQSVSRPVWVRVGNRAGKWTGWVKLTA